MNIKAVLRGPLLILSVGLTGALMVRGLSISPFEIASHRAELQAIAIADFGCLFLLALCLPPIKWVEVTPPRRRRASSVSNSQRTVRPVLVALVAEAIRLMIVR